MRESLPLENWEGTPLEALLRAAGIILGPAVGIALALVTWTRRKKRLAWAPPGSPGVLHSARKPLTWNGLNVLSFTANALISQWEKLTLNQRVQGSNPCTPTNQIKDLQQSW
jgi:hypothetical protein